MTFRVNFFGIGNPNGVIDANVGIKFTDIKDRIQYQQNRVPFGNSWTVIAKDVVIDLNAFQSLLVSGYNIKTINGISVLGSGDIAISSVVAIDYVSTATITKFDPVTSNGVVCDSNNIFHRNKLIGLATEDVLSGFGSTAIGIGEVTNPLWSWIIGDIIYLNGTTVSKVPPDAGTSVYSQILGVAVKTDTIDLKIKQSFQF